MRIGALIGIISLPVLACGSPVVDPPPGGCCATCVCSAPDQPRPIAFQAAPESLAFGTVPVGQSATLDVQITNTGTSAAGLDGLAVGAPAFGLVGPIPGTLAVGGSATVSIRFSPVAVGLVQSNVAVDTRPIPVGVCGLSGTGAYLLYSPDPVDFGVFPAGQRRSIQVTAANLVAEPITVVALSLYSKGDPSFTLTSLPALPVTLAPQGSVVFAVEDAPANKNGGVKSGVEITYLVGSGSAPLTDDLFVSGGGD